MQSDGLSANASKRRKSSEEKDRNREVLDQPGDNSLPTAAGGVKKGKDRKYDRRKEKTKHHRVDPPSQKDSVAGNESSEIDILFDRLKGKRRGADERPTNVPAKLKKDGLADKVKAKMKTLKTNGSPQVTGNKDDIFGQDVGKQRKRTDDGFVIYTEEELGLHKRGGDTPLCPFDCDCCF